MCGQHPHGTRIDFTEVKPVRRQPRVGRQAIRMFATPTAKADNLDTGRRELLNVAFIQPVSHVLEPRDRSACDMDRRGSLERFDSGLYGLR